MNFQNVLNNLTENKRKIENLIDYFARYLNTGDCEKVIVDFFHKISFYTNDLLLTEKILLKQKDSGLFNRLLEEHKLFAEKLMYFQKKFEQKKQGVCKELFDFIKNWYEEHIKFLENNIGRYTGVKNNLK